MLTRLVIQDVVLIDRLNVELAPGLNVFTGETGAGKSIVLDALGLALGARGDAGLIRAGAAQASVTAEFSGDAPDALLELAREQGLTLDDPLLLRRVIGRDGKSRAFLNDQPIGIGWLKQIGETLLEIHGQFATQGLLNPATHRALLDALAGTEGLRRKVAQAFGVWKDSENRLQEMIALRDRAAAEEEFLRAAVSELVELAPQTGEIDALAGRRSRLQHGEKILEALRATELALVGEKGATAALALAGKTVARVSDKMPGLPELLAIIDRAAGDVAEASALLDRLARATDNEPDALQRIEERLFALRGVARKHNVLPEALADLQQRLQARLDRLSDRSDQASALAKAVAAAKFMYRKLAEELSAKRRKAALDLARRVLKELPPLKLERAEFVVEVAALPEAQWGADGADRIAFLAAANPGTTPGPIGKVASGGELARFMLALKVVLSRKDPVPTLVFDEVDAGIGGATASAVGERLAQLAREVQILVVTHSPQVAARGGHHLRVLKQVKAKQAVTGVAVLDNTERVEEIARMLAGEQVTEAARGAARSLLEDGSVRSDGAARKRTRG